MVEEDVNENEQDACGTQFNALLNSLGEQDFPLFDPYAKSQNPVSSVQEQQG